MTTDLRDRTTTLFILAAPPAIWGAHFLLSYVTAAIVCEKSAAPGSAIAPVQVAIAVYTTVALVGSVLIARWGWKRHKVGNSALPHDDDTPEDRERFLGFAAFLLSGLVTVAVIYLALSVALVGTCR